MIAHTIYIPYSQKLLMVKKFNELGLWEVLAEKVWWIEVNLQFD